MLILPKPQKLMPSRNTNYARRHGHSDIKHLLSHSSRPNYKAKLGQALNTSALRKESGRKAYAPPSNNNSHWTESTNKFSDEEEELKTRIKAPRLISY